MGKNEWYVLGSECDPFVLSEPPWLTCEKGDVWIWPAEPDQYAGARNLAIAAGIATAFVVAIAALPPRNNAFVESNKDRLTNYEMYYDNVVKALLFLLNLVAYAGSVTAKMVQSNNVTVNTYCGVSISLVKAVETFAT